MIVEGLEYDPQVGDVLDFPPYLASKFISALLAEGAEFYIDGNSIVVEKVKEAPKEVVRVEVPELSPAEDLAPIEEVVEEAPAPKPAAKRGRKPAVKPVSEETVEE